MEEQWCDLTQNQPQDKTLTPKMLSWQGNIKNILFKMRIQTSTLLTHELHQHNNFKVDFTSSMNETILRKCDLKTP